MATYKEIRGTQIEAVATDPSNPVEGQVWYNTTSNVLKGQAATGAAAWASGGNMNTGRRVLMGSGIQTSALAYGGYSDTGTVAITESYNGANWTEVSDLNTARTVGGSAGSSNTDALCIGGSSAATEKWNGSSWTEVNDLTTARQALGGAGTSTLALAFGGGLPPGSGQVANTESWNGTNWTEVNDLNTARKNLPNIGTYTSALCAGGAVEPPVVANCESWNGTNWTEVNDLNTAREQLAGDGASNTAAIIFGGNPGNKANTEIWNGTNWTETTDLSTGRSNLAGAGTSTLGLAFGGANPPGTNLTATEEFTNAGTGLTRTFTDS